MDAAGLQVQSYGWLQTIGTWFETATFSDVETPPKILRGLLST
jgi:hypothetical protein